MKAFNIVISIFFAVLLVSCTSVQDNRSDLTSTKEREMTVGLVQKEIHKGMSQAGVAEALGSPNIVTKDDNEKETWIYDKIATEASYSESSSGVFLILGGISNNTKAASVTQKTLTVIIKFDQNQKVESFTYHASKF